MWLTKTPQEEEESGFRDFELDVTGGIERERSDTASKTHAPGPTRLQNRELQ